MKQDYCLIWSLNLYSLTCLGLSLGLFPHFPSGVTGGFFGLLSPVYSRSPGLFNFLLTASTLGPGGWILSQVLNWLNNRLDSGSSTCGLDFNYNVLEDDKQIEKKTEEYAIKQNYEKSKEDEKLGTFKKKHNGEQEKDGQEDKWKDGQEEEDGRKKTSTLQQDIFAFLSKSEVTFKSETGR